MTPMIPRRTIRTLALAGLAATLATASAGAPVLPDNGALVTAISGTDNVLFISQDNTLAQLAGGPLNVIEIMIDGHRNGAADSWHDRLPGTLGLLPGVLDQRGTDSRLMLSVLGNDNLFAIRQDGTGNRVTGTTSGSFNQVAVVQTGAGNSLGFSQTGDRNTIVVSQTRW